MAITTKTIAILAIASAIGFGSLVVLSEIYLSVGFGLLDGRLNGYDVEAVKRISCVVVFGKPSVLHRPFPRIGHHRPSAIGHNLCRDHLDAW